MKSRFSISRRQLVPFVFDNLPHWGEHFDKSVNHKTTLKCLSKCSPQWGRLSKKRGIVADGCFRYTFQWLVPKSSTYALKKCFEHLDFLFRQSFQNLRLGGINFESEDDDSMTNR